MRETRGLFASANSMRSGAERARRTNVRCSGSRALEALAPRFLAERLHRAADLVERSSRCDRRAERHADRVGDYASDNFQHEAAALGS
jgi:hypothetical protein